MTVFSQMDIRVQPGQRGTALKAFKERGVFEECARAIPGFIEAFLLSDTTDPDAICVIAEWHHASDFIDWTKHPARDAQERDLAHFLAAPPITRLLDRHA